MTIRHTTILVATDFSASAQLALTRAVNLPLAPEARVVLVHAAATGDAGVAARANEQLAQLARSYPQRDISWELATGRPHEQIIERTRALGADLVVMGRHGHRTLRDRLIGSVTDRTIRYGDRPVLVVDGQVERYRRPVIAVDLSDASQRVIDCGLRVIDDDIPIGLFHAYDLPYDGLHPRSKPAMLDRELAAAADESMNALISTIDADPARFHAAIRRGDARSLLLEELSARGADLVVLGTHGRSGLAHVLLGSVAESVIAAAPCDVLVTRPPRFEFAMP